MTLQPDDDFEPTNYAYSPFPRTNAGPVHCLVPKADWENRPQWRDKPTFAGRWDSDKGHALEFTDALLANDNYMASLCPPGERWFGPIPKDPEREEN